MRSFDEEFDSFIGNRDWMSVENFWRNLFQQLRLDDSKKFLIPAFLRGGLLINHFITVIVSAAIIAVSALSF